MSGLPIDWDNVSFVTGEYLDADFMGFNVPGYVWTKAYFWLDSMHSLVDLVKFKPSVNFSFDIPNYKSGGVLFVWYEEDEFKFKACKRPRTMIDYFDVNITSD